MASPKQQSAEDLIRQTLRAWGLQALTGVALGYLKKGFDTNQIQIELENTKEYKQRFSGNELRLKAGLDTLTPGQYIALEDQYRQIAKQYDLGSRFYAHDQLAKLIGGDVSAAEYQSRAQIALQTFTQAPDEYKQYWAKYGFSTGDAVSAIMDPSAESLSDLQLKANAVQIGGTALQNGVDVSAKRAMQFAENGVTLAQAKQAYQQIAAYGSNVSADAKRYGLTFDQADQENALLLGQADAVKKQNLIFSEEAANFSGRGGQSVQSAGVGGNY